MTHILIWFSALSFMGYGFSCLLGSHMKAEFKRYQLEKFQVLTGLLQILGATGLLVGLALPLVGMIAAAGLAVQMLLGFCVRLKIKDSLLQASPSFIFMWINAYLSYAFMQL
ncbi:DoxX family protein [Coraliomargarita sp. W4R53]